MSVEHTEVGIRPFPEMNYTTVADPNLRKFLEAFEKKIPDIKHWPFPCPDLMSVFHNWFGEQSWIVNRSYEMARDQGIIEFVIKPNKKIPRYFINPEQIRAFAAICWWQGHHYYQYSRLGNVPKMMADLRIDLGPHHLAQLIHDPKDEKVIITLTEGEYQVKPE